MAAALAAGNAVLAKPAEQTPITAFLATRLLHEAGVPNDVLHLLTGSGRLGEALIKDVRVRGVSFTGSNETAWSIQRALAERREAIVPFIAETGGINAMIADSSALPEQVVRDCVRSAFDSAGQRCSAARVLFLQEDSAQTTIDMLVGAIETLDIGDPFDYATDIGPVIDEESQDRLEAHKIRMQREARELVDLMLPEHCRAGSYVTPAVYEIDALDRTRARGVRPDPARRALPARPSRQGDLDAQRLGLWPDAGSAQPHRDGGRLRRRARARRQSLRQPQPDRRRRRRAAVRRRRAVGDGSEGRRAALRLRPMRCERVRTTDITATGGNLQLLSGAVTES